MVKKYIFLLLFWMGITGFMPLTGQVPRNDFAARGAALDNFFFRLRTKIAHSFSESAKHFMLIWKSMGEAGEEYLREKASAIGVAGEKKAKDIWKSTSGAVGDSLEQGKDSVRDSLEAGKDSVRDSLERGKDTVSSAVEEKKFP